MISTSISSNIFPCIGCTHSGVCKYEESVMSFCRSNNTAPAIDCLSIVYRCKYQQNSYATILRADQINYCNTTSRPYTIDTSSECIDKI